MARILVVDDEESILYTFDSFLSDEGHEVVAARDYEEALRRIADADPDVVFSDIILGGKTGIDILRAVKERGLTSPVVMMTGYPILDTATEAVRLGAFDYVTKPVVQGVLLRIANLALQHKRVLDEREWYRSHLEAIFGSIEDAIITVDREMTILELNDAARSWLAVHGYDEKQGARPMGRLIDREIRRRLADEILFGGLTMGGLASVETAEERLVIRCTPRDGGGATVNLEADDGSDAGDEVDGLQPPA